MLSMPTEKGANETSTGAFGSEILKASHVTSVCRPHVTWLALAKEDGCLATHACLGVNRGALRRGGSST